MGERMSVGFTAKAADELSELVGQTGLSKAAVINRAVSVYAFVESQLQQGRELLTRDRQSGEQSVVHIL